MLEGQARMLLNIGSALANQGRASEARTHFEQALEISQRIGMKPMRAAALGNLAQLSLELSDISTARKWYAQALAHHRESGEKSMIAWALRGQGEIHFIEGDLAAARTRLEESISISREIGERGEVAITQLALASLSLEEGQAPAAEDLTRQALKEFVQQKLRDQSASAQALLAEVLAERGRIEEAHAQIAEAAGLARDIDNLRIRLRVGLGVARVRLASKQYRDAERQLNEVLTEATRARLFDLQLDSRLALGECELQSGRNEVGRARLRRLEEEARAKGFGLVASRAGKLRRS
jgi:tetratricopeptide (TPR) repeat protein